jgi:hypothetical protein
MTGRRGPTMGEMLLKVQPGKKVKVNTLEFGHLPHQVLEGAR